MLFLAVVVPPAVTLVWLGLRLLEQDRSLAAQRAVERRDAALQAVAFSLEQSLSDAQRWFVADTPPGGVVRFSVTGDSLRAEPPGQLAWNPAAPPLVPASAREFIEAEQAKFGGRSLRALSTYESLAASSSPAVRAGALLRVARVYRRDEAWDRALSAYRKLALIDDVAIDGMPADLVARRAIGFVLADAGRAEELSREAASLEHDLLTGRWTLAKLRTNFVSAVSHEFRTPLASLRHVTELLTESDAVPPQERRAFYEVLARNTDRLQRLVESLLDFSRMEEGRKPYELQQLRAGALARQVVADFVRDGGTRNAAIDVRVDQPADIEIQVDPVAAGQAIWNVLDNAVKYSPGQPVIEVTVAPHSEGIAIGVRDQGLGIPSSEQQQIFGKFVRGEQATRLGIKGTGLGLSIVSHIMQAHGGAVEVESRVGGGSSFVLVFPAASCRPDRTV